MDGEVQIRTKDCDYVAAMMSRGAKLGPHEVVPRAGGGTEVFFNLSNLDPEAMDDYRTGAAKFSIRDFSICRQGLMKIIHTPQ